MKNAILIFTLLILVSCASTKIITTTSQADVDRVAAKYPGFTLEQLNQGKMLFETHCNNCHGLKKPASRTAEQWSKIVPRMAVKVNKKSEVLNTQGQELILRYLVTMGSK